MSRKYHLYQWLTFLASLPFLYFVITGKAPNWLYYLSLAVILGNAVATMVINWKKGNKQSVKTQLLSYGAILLVCFALVLIFS